MTDLQKVCEDEQIISRVLSICQRILSKDFCCEYIRLYPNGRYCFKRKELENAKEYGRFQDKQGEHTGVGI